MKITVFTITDCYFCKQEKDYLKANNLPFEERNLEENRDWLTEMLTISNNFAGTPVTKIEKDDGSIVVLKGFTKDEFDETLGLVPAVEHKAEEVSAAPAQDIAPKAVMPVAETPKVEVAAPIVAAPMPAAEQAVSAPDAASIAAQIEQLKRLQESLMAQTQKAPEPQPAPIVAPPVVSAPPVQVAPQAAPVVQAAAPVAAPTQGAVDDSLAAILAELQAKINTANSPGGTQSTPQS